MSRKHFNLCTPLLAAGAFALLASGHALADDNSMSQWTGESYAYFNNLDYSLGKFNVARAPRTLDAMVAGTAMPAMPHVQDRAVTPAIRPLRSTLPTPFRDDTGG